MMNQFTASQVTYFLPYAINKKLFNYHSYHTSKYSFLYHTHSFLSQLHEHYLLSHLPTICYLMQWVRLYQLNYSQAFGKLIKQMQKQTRRTMKQYNKQGCQLQQFPIIKLHLFNNIQILNLSKNIISNLPDLTIHNATSQYALANLKIVNLSKNQFPTVASLQPLAQTATNIHSLNIQDNPLVMNLNFLYQLAIIFTNITTIFCGEKVEIDNEIRQEMIKQQKIGGKIMSQFLEIVKDKTQNVRLLNIEQQERRITKILQQFQKPLCQIADKNRRIFQQMDIIINQSSGLTSLQQTYRSPERTHHYNPRKNEIEILSEYQITKQSNNLMRYLTQSDQKPMNLNVFYFKELVYKKSIYAKIIQEIQVPQELLQELQKGNPDAITFDQLLAQINKKWINNMLLTSNYENRVDHHRSFSPLKSIQTDMTSRIRPNYINVQHLDRKDIYFGLDKQWTCQTQNFIKHRLLSLLRNIGQIKGQRYSSPIQRFQSYHNSYSDKKIKQSQVNYQTFGTFQLQTQEYGTVKKEQIKVVLPKSKNKFIVGSLVNILEQGIKKVVFRKILQTRILKKQNINHYFLIIHSIVKRYKQFSFRKIYQASIFFQCLKHKMNKLRLKNLFKAWKKLKIRKLKLLKIIFNRKIKKQTAFMSVFLTQYRINSRNISLQAKISNFKSQFQRQSYSLADMSSILKRSVTLKQKNKQIDQKILVKKCYSKYSTLKK